MMRDMSEPARVVVLTGASAGIGAAVARRLGARGDSLVLAARRKSELDQVARDAGGAPLVVVTDVTRRDEVERLRTRALEAFGRVDVWINNAGRGISRSVQELTDEDVDAMMASNVKSALYGMQAIVPHFKERGAGHLVNVSSFLGRIPLAPPRAAYAAAKAALGTLTTCLRAELRATHPGIHVSLVMPGIVLTDFATNALHGVPFVPPPGAGPGSPYAPQTPDEVAAAIADLLDHPHAELYTNDAQRGMPARYYADVEAFERQRG
jgi:NAD(P)-dependent dehydrogenase (short-subunit alcohol dehydrogenase family)